MLTGFKDCLYTHVDTKASVMQIWVKIYWLYIYSPISIIYKMNIIEATMSKLIVDDSIPFCCFLNFKYVTSADKLLWSLTLIFTTRFVVYLGGKANKHRLILVYYLILLSLS